MVLAPYYVLWAFTAATVVGLALGLLWLFYHHTMEAVFRRLWGGDAVAAWGLYAAAYHTLFFARPETRAILASPPGLLVLWGLLTLYAVVRVALWRKPALGRVAAMGVGLAAWAFCLGAGYGYLDLLKADAALLGSRPQALLAPGAELAPLRRAGTLTRLPTRAAKTLQRLVAHLEGGKAPGDEQRALFHSVLLPALEEAFRRDVQRLRTYQALQILLLGGVLLGWGFGKKPGG